VFTVVINGDDRKKFRQTSEYFFKDKADAWSKHLINSI